MRDFNHVEEICEQLQADRRGWGFNRFFWKKSKKRGGVKS